MVIIGYNKGRDWNIIRKNKSGNLIQILTACCNRTNDRDAKFPGKINGVNDLSGSLSLVHHVKNYKKRLFDFGNLQEKIEIALKVFCIQYSNQKIQFFCQQVLADHLLLDRVT